MEVASLGSRATIRTKEGEDQEVSAARSEAEAYLRFVSLS